MESIMAGIELFQKGGIIMYVLLLCSFFVLSIAIERFRYFQAVDAGRHFAIQFFQYMTAEKWQEAKSLAAGARGDVPRIISEAWALIGEENISDYMEIQSGIALSRLRRRLYYLNVVVTMAPLLGLLGTISGMISAFSVFNIESGQATAITGGVGEALIATAMGLCVAIISLAIHAYFMQRIENIITDMEQCFSVLEKSVKKLSVKMAGEA